MLTNKIRVLVSAGALLGMSMSLAAASELKKFVAQIGAPVPAINNISMYVAQQAGFFKEEGLDVEFRYSQGAAQATQIAAAEQADGAFVTFEPAILGYDKGVRGKIVLSSGKQLIYFIAVPADSSINTVADLAGKKIGVINLGSGAVPVVRSILHSAGVEVAADMLLPVGFGDQAMAALKSDQVQALGLFSGVYFGLERAGFSFRYFKHPTLETFGNTGLFVSDAVIAKKPDDICGFGRAYTKGTLFTLANPEAAVRMWWEISPSSRRGATDEEALKNGLAELKQITATYDTGFPPEAQNGLVDEAKLKEYMELLKGDGQISRIPPADAIATKSFAKCINSFDGLAVRKLAQEWKK